MGIELGQLIKAILSAATPAIKNKLTRHPIVIQLLQQFHLDPEHPPANFSGIYAYALVEYGVGQPQAVLDLFREPTIKQAFRNAFERNDPALLLREAEDFLDWNIIGDRIRDLNINPRYEFAAFSAIFIQIANRSRTPAQTLRDQKLDSLQHSLSQLQDQLARQTTLAEARIQLAQQAQNNPALFSEPTPNPFPSFILAQQLQAWFDTLNYPLESQQVCTETRFQCILNLPARRRSYDRILVLAIDGEAETSDIQTLQQAVAHHRTDEGWLVASRRISPAARAACTQPDHRYLFCYTFDELLDETADFGPYLDWLEADIQRRRIPEHYIPLACSKEELDPITNQRLATSRYGERDGWIDGYIDRWIDDPTKEHISILGEFGTGKTWFALHYVWTALQRYRDAQQRGTARPRLPLVIPLRDYAKAVSVESLFSEFLFRQHKIGLPHYSVFEQLNRMGKLLLIFDGFDEMAARIDRQQMINNFWELAKVIVPGAKAILTCRTEHFPEAREGRQLLNAELQASTANLTGEAPQFEVLELEKFSDDQIRQALTHHTSATTVQTVMDNAQLLDLARRPIMTEFILDALPDIEADKPIDLARLYLYAVRHKMERDIKAERTFTSLADKLYFLCELSWEMLSTDRMSLNYREFPDRLRRLFGPKVQAEKDLDHWHYDMMGQTLLIRNAAGDYSPAHRSLLEFFVAYKLAAELGVLAPDCLHLARAQAALDPSLPAQDCTWSAYFRRDVDASRTVVPIPPLNRFTAEPLPRLRRTLGQAILPKAVLDLLVPLLDPADTTHDRLLDIIKATRHQTVEDIGYIGGNATTLLLKIDIDALRGCDLEGTVILNTDFTEACLHRTNLAQANLTHTVFPRKLGDGVTSVAFSPDGQWLATGDLSGFVNLWEVANGRQLWRAEGHTNAEKRDHFNCIYSVAFSSHGKMLASGGLGCTIKIWDTRTGQCLRAFPEDTKEDCSVVFSPNGSILASGGFKPIVRLWNAQTGECLKTLRGNISTINAIAFSPDGKILATGDDGRVVKLWDVGTGECLKTLQDSAGLKSVYSVAFSPDGSTLAIGDLKNHGKGRMVKLWDISTGEYSATILQHDFHSTIHSVAFAQTNNLLASGDENGKIVLWDVKTQKYIKTLQGCAYRINSVAFSPDDRTIASGGNNIDGIVEIWDIETGQCLQSWWAPDPWIHSLAVNPEGTVLASGDREGKIMLWDIQRKEHFKTLRGHTNYILALAFSADGSLLASGSAEGDINLWDVCIGQRTQTWSWHTEDDDPLQEQSIVFSPNGKMLMSLDRDNIVRLRDIYTGECLEVFESDEHPIYSVAFHQNGTPLATIRQSDKTIEIWNPLTRDLLSSFQLTPDPNPSVRFSPNGNIIIAGDKDDNAKTKFWDITTGKCVSTLPINPLSIRTMAFNLDMETLAAIEENSTVKLWSIHTRECLKTFQGHAGSVNSVTFTPDGNILISGSSDETIKFWDVHSGECLKTLSNKPYAGMNITGAIGLREAQKASLKALGAVEQ